MIEIEDALREHQGVIAALAPFAPEIRKAAHRMADCLAAGGKILWMGNGGSAAEISLVVAGRAFLDKYEEILSRRGNSCAV